MRKLNFLKKNVNESLVDEIPYYLQYPTPRLDRYELHKKAYPLLDVHSFEPNKYGKYMANIANDIRFDNAFDSKIRTEGNFNRKNNEDSKYE